MKRVPLQRKPFRRKPTTATEKPKKPVSLQRARKAKADAEYAVTRAQRLVRARGQCEFLVNPDMVTSRCARVATQTHHVVRRSHSGEPDHSVENLLALCATHHALIHANVQWAKAHGYIKTSWSQIE